MASRKIHEEDCFYRIGDKCSKAHWYLDRHFAYLGVHHRFKEHHKEGIIECAKYCNTHFGMDYDLCIELEPDEIEECIRAAGRRAYLTGKRFGTIGCKIDGEMVEITTFRAEKYNKNNRKQSFNREPRCKKRSGDIPDT